MIKIDEILRKNSLIANRYEKVNNVFIIDTNEGRIVAKENSYDNEIYNYLKTRNFNYYPKIINNNDNYTLTEYINDYNIPKEQKILDMITLISLLHYKTTHYKEITEDDYKEIYEDISNNIEYLNSYYLDLITYIETKIYMSPSEQVLAFNISKIFDALIFTKNELNDWYEIAKEEKKQRLVVLHNNLSIDHFIQNENSYLISWDKSKIGMPIFDLYKLYKRHCLDFDFEEIFKKYELKFPLNEVEKKLFFILIALPDKYEFNDNEYLNTINAGKLIDIIYKTEQFISKENSKT